MTRGTVARDAERSQPRTEHPMIGTPVPTPGQVPGPGPLGDEAGRPASEVPVRAKLAALWAATMLLFAYGDLFALFRRDVIDDITNGEVGGFSVGQPFLLATSAYVAIPALMVFLCLVMTPTVGRWTNIVLGSVYAVTVALSMIGEGWAYYLFLSVLEIGLLALIVRYAWSWSRPAGPSHGPRA
jgi:hypothetical protein